VALPGTPDIVFWRARLAIFVDGCFWHMCPLHGSIPQRNAPFWGQKLARNVERDREVDSRLEALGWRPLRVWEHEIREHLDGVVDRIRKAIAADSDGAAP
jgi:DNA mismatch endonuclease (patch repair protein)